MIEYEEAKSHLIWLVVTKDYLWRTFQPELRRSGTRLVFQIPFFGSDATDLEISCVPDSKLSVKYADVKYADVGSEVYDYIFSKGKIEIYVEELVEYRTFLEM